MNLAQKTKIIFALSLLIGALFSTFMMSKVAALSTYELSNKNFAVQRCGGDGANNGYTPSIEIGCKGIGNPIIDAIFAIIRFITNGVGIVIIASVVYGGIQYTLSRGDPQATAQAINRLRTSVIALLFFIFAYAFLNYIIPNGFFKQ